MPPWLSQIRSVQRKEGNINSSRWIQLATVGIDNTPRVRTVVFRGWSKSYEMEIYTDKRSEKFNELDLNNKVEICWLFFKSKCQFRFRGTSRIYMGKECLPNWNQLNKKSKSMWGWPRPGDKYDIDNKGIYSEKTKVDLRDNFAVLKIEISYVDQLLLIKPMHIRRRWVKEQEWLEERINP